MDVPEVWLLIVWFVFSLVLRTLLFCCVKYLIPVGRALDLLSSVVCLDPGLVTAPKYNNPLNYQCNNCICTYKLWFQNFTINTAMFVFQVCDNSVHQPTYTPQWAIITVSSLLYMFCNVDDGWNIIEYISVRAILKFKPLELLFLFYSKYSLKLLLVFFSWFLITILMLKVMFLFSQNKASLT